MARLVFGAGIFKRFSILFPYFRTAIHESEQKSCTRYVNTQISQKYAQRKLLPFEVDTKVAKDVVLYQYDNTRFHRLLSLFAFGQFFFWAYLSHFAYTCLRDAPVKRKPIENENEKDLPFWRKINIGQNKYRYGLTVLCASIGYFIITGACFFSFRSISSLVLLRGGEKIRIVTYKPFAMRRKLEVPVSHTTCFHSRNDATSYLSLKVKGYYMYFLLDKSGTFANRELFDYTAGMKRLLK